MTETNTFRVKKGNPFLFGVGKMYDGFNFTIEVPQGAQASLLLYKDHSEEPVEEIPFGEGRIGRICSMKLVDFDSAGYEYNFRVNGSVCPDPAATSIHGREEFGAPMTEEEHRIRCGFLPQEEYDWEGDCSPDLAYEDMILYKLHVRGYTRQYLKNSRKRGTFQGLIEMIPYWKELGINAIELMPAYEFMELPPAKRENRYITSRKDYERVNYWGYGPGYYYAPKRSYCATDKPENEFRDLIKALHRAGIECIMEFYFAKTCNPLYILRALEFWKLFYHVDGFHIQGENLSMDLILRDGILAETKMMVPGYDFGSLYQGKSPEKRYLAEYHPGFLQDMRRFLKSDEDMVEKAMWHIRSNHNDHAVVNYIVGHDGFTLNDLVSYNYRHNEENGEENRDGSSYNYSWNCGVEGPTRKQSVKRIRERQMRNAIFMLLLSQGVPLLYGGDEIGNSQEGNNNAWCQDNPIGWIDWKGLKKNEALLKFVKKAIAFRKAHPILHTAKEMKESDYLAKGFPDISFHGERAWYVNRENTSRLFGVMYYGAYSGREETGQTPAQEDFVYVAYNFHWEKRSLALPNLPEGLCWEKIADTGETAPEGCFYEKGRIYHKSVETGPRTIVVLVGRQEEKK